MSSKKEANAFAEQVRSESEAGAARLVQGVEAAAEFSRQSAHELARSAGVASKAAEKIGAEAVTATTRSMREGWELVQQAAETRTVADLVELQANFIARSCGEMISRSAAAHDVARGAMENAVEVATGRAVAFAGLARPH